MSCGGSAERIVAGQARQYGKEGKPVGERATTITVSHIERERGVHLTLHPLPAAVAGVANVPSQVGQKYQRKSAREPLAQP